ncbi:MAG: phosphatase PAP2 family protein [Tepidiformaceae bacterium]
MNTPGCSLPWPAFAVGLARVFVGVHLPGDVVLGLLVGLLAATVT